MNTRLPRPQQLQIWLSPAGLMAACLMASSVVVGLTSPAHGVEGPPVPLEGITVPAVVRNATTVTCQPDPTRWSNVDAATQWSARITVAGSQVAPLDLEPTGALDPVHYTPVAADRGKAVWCEVTATNVSESATQFTGGVVRRAGIGLNPATTLRELGPAAAAELTQPVGYRWSSQPRSVRVPAAATRAGTLAVARATATTQQGDLALELRTFSSSRQAKARMHGWCDQVRRTYKTALPPGGVQGFLLCKRVRLAGVKDGWRAITYVSEWAGRRPITTHKLHFSGRVQTSVVSVKSSWQGSYYQQQPTIRKATRAGRIATIAVAARVRAQ